MKQQILKADQIGIECHQKIYETRFGYAVTANPWQPHNKEYISAISRFYKRWLITLRDRMARTNMLIAKFATNAIEV